MANRKEERDLAAEIINYEPRYKLDELPEVQALAQPLPWPKKKNGESLAPKSQRLPKTPKPSAALPKADIVVVTWTVAEGFALGDVLTPGYRDVRSKNKIPKNTTPWYTYRPSNFSEYKKKLRPAAPARKANRLGSYFMTSIYSDVLKRNAKVLCFKSELHLNRDWVANRISARTIPVADLFVQMIQESKPKLFITVGTAGGTLNKSTLGDVMVTRAAKFRFSKGFVKAPFARAIYKCKSLSALSASQLKATVPLLKQFQDRLDPKLVTRVPKIWVDGNYGSFPKFMPILTTDGFEFGTTKNGRGYKNYLGNLGCGVEMGDAVLGMVIKYLEDPTAKVPWEFSLPTPQALESAKETIPKWLVVRNASDPQINSNLTKKAASNEAVFYYKKYGYFTSVNSAIAVWAVIRALRY
jgi:hypothetical protein